MLYLTLNLSCWVESMLPVTCDKLKLKSSWRTCKNTVCNTQLAFSTKHKENPVTTVSFCAYQTHALHKGQTESEDGIFWILVSSYSFSLKGDMKSYSTVNTFIQCTSNPKYWLFTYTSDSDQCTEQDRRPQHKPMTRKHWDSKRSPNQMQPGAKSVSTKLTLQEDKLQCCQIWLTKRSSIRA